MKGKRKPPKQSVRPKSKELARPAVAGPLSRRAGKQEAPKLSEAIEQSLIGGNLINLNAEQRVSLYMATCKSLRLNPLTNPFCYILVKDWEESTEKLILYAAKNCTDQLRQLYGVTTVPGSIKQWQENGMLMATVSVQDRLGRADSDIGVIPIKRYSRKRNVWYDLSGAMLANAMMHVLTKAKRRATLSLCGLGGIVDETELDTMQVVGGVTRGGRIWRYSELPPAPESFDENAPHGHAAGSDKAKKAEASLKRIEQADKEFTTGAEPRRADAKTTAGETGPGLNRPSAEMPTAPIQDSDEFAAPLSSPQSGIQKGADRSSDHTRSEPPSATKAPAGSLPPTLPAGASKPPASGAGSDSGGPKQESGARRAGKAGESLSGPPSAQSAKVVFIRLLPNFDFQVWGYLADEAMQNFFRDTETHQYKSAKDGKAYWRLASEYLVGFKDLCAKLGVAVEESR